MAAKGAQRQMLALDIDLWKPSGMHSRGVIPTVMVVDDQQVNRDLLSSILSREGFQVCAVDSGEQALEQLEASCPDAVLLDVVMPGMNGFECLQRIRRCYDATELPVIMATVDADRESTVAALHHGANDYVTKPFDPDVLLARTRGHVRLRQLAQQLRVSEERYALAAEGSNAGLYDWNIAQNSIYLAPRWKELLGYGPDELADLPEEWLTRIHPDDLNEFRMLTDDSVSLNSHVELEMRMRHRDGRYRWMRCTGVLQRDEHGGVGRLAGSLADVTAGKVRDPLTGLPNRLLFEDRLDMALQSGDLVGVLFLDLDDFKLVNDSLGHHVGDQLLVSVSERLCSTVCNSPSLERSRTVARMGGDEFAILVEQSESLEDLETLATDLLKALAAPHHIEAHEVSAPGSIGITAAESRSKVAADMLREADTAMYHAKASEGPRLRVFDPEMRQRASRRMRLERDLRNALPLEEFYLKYQPIVALKSGAIDRFEALARWNRPRQELVDPSVFIPVAEDLGLISELGTWVLGNACQAAVAWRESLPEHLAPRVAVNVSIRELQQPEFLELLQARQRKQE